MRIVARFGGLKGGAVALAIWIGCLACTGTASQAADLDAGDGGPGADGGPDAGPSDGGSPTDGGANIGVAAIPLAGCGVNYTATVTVGGSQAFTFILDTGSASLAVAASSCRSCIDGGVAPLYTPGAGAIDEHTTAETTYANTTGWFGEIYQDTVSLGALPSLAVDLVAIESENDFFPVLDFYCHGSISGVLGFGPRALLDRGTTSYLDQVAAAGLPDVFSFQLCPSGGTLWLGGVDARFGPQFTPMVSDQLFYTTLLSSIAVGEKSLGLTASDLGDAFIDTGGQAFWLPRAAFDAVVSTLGADANFTSLFGDARTFFAPNGHCVAVAKSAAELDALLPPLTLTFGSGLALQSSATSSYLYDLPGCGYTPALATRASGSGLPPIELGAPILKNKVVVIDRAQQRIGFAPAPCQ